jgi:hypothetical protein
MAGRSDIKAGGAYIALGMKDAGLFSGLRGAMSNLASTAKGFAVVGAAGIGAAAAIGGVALKAFMDAGSALQDMHDRTGISVEALGELQHAAEMGGADLETLEGGIVKMQKALGKSGDVAKPMQAALKEIGLEAAALQKMSPEQQFDAIAKGVGKVSDPTKKAALAMTFFGKSGAKLLPMIKDMEALRKEARDMGFVMSAEGASNAETLGDKLDNLWKTVRFGAITIGEILAPAMLKIVDIIQPIATSVLKWMQSIRDAILGGQLQLAGEIAFTGLRIVALKAIALMSDLVGGALGDFMGSIGSKFAGGDFAGAWGDAVSGMLEAWSLFSQGVVEIFAGAANGVIKLWQGVQDKITDFILKNASEGGWLGKLALAGTGVDMQAEVARGKKLDDQLRARGVDPGKDTLSQAQADARGITAGRVEKMTAAIDAMKSAAEQTAQDATRNRETQTGGGANRAQDALTAEMAKLEALRAQLNKQDAVQGAGAGGDNKSEQVAGLQQKVAGTFSAAAAMALGGSGSRSERLLADIKKTNEKQEDLLKGIMRATGLGGLVT